jgi:hypothetical protein
MNTNQFWNTENIKAVASLWPLALICFLILLLLVLVLFFLPQTRGFLNGLKNFRFKIFNAEASVNQPPSESPKTNLEIQILWQHNRLGSERSNRKVE